MNCTVILKVGSLCRGEWFLGIGVPWVVGRGVASPLRWPVHAAVRSCVGLLEVSALTCASLTLEANIEPLSGSCAPHVAALGVERLERGLRGDLSQQRQVVSQLPWAVSPFIAIAPFVTLRMQSRTFEARRLSVPLRRALLSFHFSFNLTICTALEDPRHG